FVIDDLNCAAGDMVVRHLHTIIKIFGGAADMKDVDESGVPARDRLECRHSFKFAQKRAFTFKRAAVDNLHRPQCARDCSCYPNLAVSAAPDHSQKLVIGNDWNLGGNVVGNGGDFTQTSGWRQFWSSARLGVES